ncbi:flavoprotein [Nonomuraea sp. NPDC002799]
MLRRRSLAAQGVDPIGADPSDAHSGRGGRKSRQPPRVPPWQKDKRCSRIRLAFVPVLYVVTSAAPSHAGPVADLVVKAQDAHWRVSVVSTPMGVRFLDQSRLEELTGEPVRKDFRMPGEGKELPKADAVIAAPTTVNTINKWAAGITDNFALDLLCELTGYGVPIVAVPMVKPAAPYDKRMPSWDDVLGELHQLIGGTSA